MSFWSRLFGRGLPARTRGPEAEQPGAMRNGKKHGLWIEREEHDWQLAEVTYVEGVREGAFRFWNRETGALRLSGTMVAGEQHGTVEGWREGALSFRAEKVAGKLHGALVTYRPDGSIDHECTYRDGKIWSGPYDIESTPGTYIRRATYVDGERDGPYEENTWSGQPTLRATYRIGTLHGPYAKYHPGGSLAVEGTYAEGKRVGTWRQHLPDGTVIAESDDGVTWRTWGLSVVARDDDELVRWVALAEAWTKLGRPPDGQWSSVENAVDAFEDAGPAVTWVETRIAERGKPSPHRTTSGWLAHLLGHDDDARARLIDGISTDHDNWEREHVTRVVRRAPFIRNLDLYECTIEGGVDALFGPEVAWPGLERLSIVECGSLGGLVERLAVAPWTEQLTKLALQDDERFLDGAHAAALLHSAHLPLLRELELHEMGKGFAEALQTAPLLRSLERLELRRPEEVDAILRSLALLEMPELRELEVHADEATIPRNVLLGLAARARRPALTRLELRGFVAPSAKTLAEIKKRRPDLELIVEER